MNVDMTNTEGGVEPLRIGVVVGSTRPGRRADAVATWVQKVASRRDDLVVEVIDPADFDLPLLDEPVPAAVCEYRNRHTLAWSHAVAPFDGYVFVVPEYNHAYPAVVKNAIDYLYREWQDKAAGLVTYGITGGIRAGEQLRLVLAEVQVATVRTHVALDLSSAFPDSRSCTPDAAQEKVLERMLGELAAWAGALRGLRATS